MKLQNNHTILALGADIKSRYCIFKNNRLSSSKDFGNLDNPDNFTKFKKSISKIKLNPEVVAFDMHPAYFSTQFANSLIGRKIPVQHHHAHIASILATNKISKPVIGVAFDGTGYGSDGNIWGGEFMVVDRIGFRRVAHFKYLKMPGGEIAVREPQRMAFSITYGCLGDRIFKEELDFLKIKPKSYYDVLIKMFKQNINSPLTSSVGRLFDAVSSILGICHKIKFEAEAAIKLEKLASRSSEKGWYEFDIFQKDKTWIFGYNKLVKGILCDIKKGIPKQDIARKFHNSLVEIIIKAIDKISHKYHLKDVVLSGGVFQNKILFDSVKQRLKQSGYNLILNKDIPLNDLSICLGQIYIAQHSERIEVKRG